MEAKRCQSPFLIFSKNIIMKKLLFSFLMLAIPLMASAQIRMGYFSYNAILTTMTDYKLAKRSVDDLRLKYDAEMKRSEKEFNDKYEEFLEVQRDLVPSILRKRQAELQEMMEKNTAFKNDAIRLLEQAENDALAPVKRKLNEAVARVGRERGYILVLNTDNDACPYIDPELGEDATEAIKEAIK